MMQRQGSFISSKSKDEGTTVQVLGVDDNLEKDGNAPAAAGQVNLHRKLQSRHMQMISLGGIIGAGYFFSMGAVLVEAGPAGNLISFGLVGALLWLVMQSLAEMSSYLTISGSFMTFSTRFIHPAVGFATAWNYWFLWCSIGMSEYNGIVLICSYWNENGTVPSWAIILIAWVIFMSFGALGVRAYGEAEFWLSTFKLICVLLSMIASILIAAGAVGKDSPKIGFTYYREPGPFSNGVAGVFKALPYAALSMVGSEMLGITSGEASNPTRDVPKACKQIVYRIGFVFIGGLFFMNLVVPYNDPNLLSASSQAASAPLAIAFNRVGYPVVASIISAICLVATISAINGTLYISSRTLANMALEGHAPKFFGKTTKQGVPIYAMLFTNLGCLLSLLNLASGPGVLFTWLVNISGVSSFIAWTSIMLCHLRFRKAMKLQGIPVTDLPFRTWIYPYGTWIGFLICLFFTFFQGWTAFLTPFNLIAFLQAYILIPVVVLFGLGHWLYHRDPAVDLSTADLKTGHSDWNKEQLADVLAEDWKPTGWKSYPQRAWTFVVG